MAPPTLSVEVNKLMELCAFIENERDPEMRSAARITLGCHHTAIKELILAYQNVSANCQAAIDMAAQYAASYGNVRKQLTAALTRAETAESERDEARASVGVVVSAIVEIEAGFRASKYSYGASLLAHVLSNLPQSARAEMERVKALEANQRTAGTVEVCEICNRAVDQFSDDGCGWVGDSEDHDEPGYDECPLRALPPLATDSAEGVSPASNPDAVRSGPPTKVECDLCYGTGQRSGWNSGYDVPCGGCGGSGVRCIAICGLPECTSHGRRLRHDGEIVPNCDRKDCVLRQNHIEMYAR